MRITGRCRKDPHNEFTQQLIGPAIGSPSDRLARNYRGISSRARRIRGAPSVNQHDVSVAIPALAPSSAVSRRGQRSTAVILSMTVNDCQLSGSGLTAPNQNFADISVSAGTIARSTDLERR